MSVALDHLVFAARSLAEGTAWLTERLGCPPAGGGAHPLMGTHNSLWRMGDAYIEVICVDPEAPPPGRPRWYALDDPATVARMARGPILHHWVVQVPDLAAARTGAAPDPGPALRVTRDALHWDLTVPDDGGLHFGGAYPTLIQWPEGVQTPPARMPDQGLGLERLTVFGPPALRAGLETVGATALVNWQEAEVPGFAAEIATPRGPVRFSTAP